MKKPELLNDILKKDI